MPMFAATLEGSRTFNDGVKVTWTPSGTPSDVVVEIDVGGDLAWENEFVATASERVDCAGDTFTIEGSLSVNFGSTGMTGQLWSDITWTVDGNNHLWKGLVGVW